MKKKILGVIPARGGSKGILRKNIKKLGDVPLVVHTINQALKSKKLDFVIVSTDDEEIAEIAKNAGALVPSLRNKEYAEDHVPLVPDLIKHVSDQFNEKYEHDMIVLLEPTYPFRNSQTIDKCISTLEENPDKWVVTVTETKQHPFRSRKMDSENILSPFFDDDRIFLQRQDLPKAYSIKGAVYAIHKKYLQTENNILKKDWLGVIIDQKQAVDIDDMYDFFLAQAILNNEDK